MLVWALCATLLVAAVVFVGTTSFLALEKVNAADFASEAQAYAVAEAGIVDAYAWFRRQQVQPVTTFAPRRNLAAVPPVNETDDPAIGLVREYEITPSLWGRYEVRKPVAAETFTDANGNGVHDGGETFVDANGNGVRDPARETRDVSVERGLPGAGGAWALVSHGVLYRRPRQDLPLGTPPNDRVAGVTLKTQIRRLTITPPSAAAVCSRTGSGITIGNRGRIVGGSNAGLAYASGTGTPSRLAGSEVTGSPATTAVPSYADSVSAVFGVTAAELRGLADASYTDASAFPSPIGEYTLHVIDGSTTFDAATPLRGTGVVVVLGNCTVASGSNSFFNGLLYVQGNLTLRGPAYLRGTVVATGTADVRGTGGDYVEVDQDQAIVAQILTIMGQYRYSMAQIRPAPTRSSGAPDDFLSDLGGGYGVIR